MRWPPVVATAAGRGRCRCHRPPPARHPHTVPHVHGTLHAVALPLAVLPKTVIQRLFHVHVGCANCVEPCARDTASDLKRIQNLRWSIGCTASQVGPSGTAHVSSELVKAHIPHRGRPSCRNNGQLSWPTGHHSSSLAVGPARPWARAQHSCPRSVCANTHLLRAWSPPDLQDQLAGLNSVMHPARRVSGCTRVQAARC